MQRGRQVAEDNPLAVGAAAVVAGFGVGLLLPSTRAERERIGEKRDELVEDVRETVGELGRAVKETARDIASSESMQHH